MGSCAVSEKYVQCGNVGEAKISHILTIWIFCITNSVQSRYPTQSTQSGKMNEGKNENDLWAFAFA